MKDEPAFPCELLFLGNSGEQVMNFHGLTKREYFAGLAMQALLDHSWDQRKMDLDCAARAVKYADALLAELEKEK